jgi:hypothetical protein
MLPYILAAVGGYLIGDSIKTDQYADGGMMMAKGGLTESQEELISDAIASEELKEKAKKKIKQGDAILSVSYGKFRTYAYTDYGGDFGDKVLIEYFKKNYPKNIVFESAAYNGQNAILFGKPVEEFKKLDSAWDFEDSESFYLDLQSEVEEKEFKEFVKHLKYKKYKVSPKTLDWLLQNRSGYYHMRTFQPFGLDFNSEELENELIEEGLIKK